MTTESEAKLWRAWPNYTAWAADRSGDRARTLGSSEASTALGLNPYEGAFALWQAKREGHEKEETPAMLAGRLLEPAAGLLYATLYQLELLRPHELLELGPEAEFVTFQHPGFPWMTATPDFFVRDERGLWILEVKCPGYRMSRTWGETPPIWVQTQVVHQWEVVRHALREPLVGARIVAHFGSDDLRAYDVIPEAKFTSRMLEAEQAFMRLIETGQAPAIDGSESASEWLRREYTAVAGAAKEVPHELVRQVLLWTEERKAAEANEKEARNELMLALGEATVATIEGVQVATWKEETRNYKAKEAYTTTSRTLRLSPQAAGVVGYEKGGGA